MSGLDLKRLIGVIGGLIIASGLIMPTKGLRNRNIETLLEDTVDLA